MRVLLSCFLLVSSAGCVFVPPQRPVDATRSLVGVRIASVAPVGIFTIDSSQVFFIRLASDSGPLPSQFPDASELIPSNYTDGDYAYLLNAEPGTYAAVAARHESSGGAYNRVSVFTSYLSSEIIAESRVTVDEASVAFMGEFTIQTSTRVDRMDDAQRHFFSVIEPGKRSGFSLFSSQYSYTGSLKTVDRSPEARQRFMSQASRQLGEYGWSAMLDQ